MNQEELINDQPQYNLITITWADLQGCTEGANFGNGIILKPSDTLQFIQTPFNEEQLQNIVIRNDKESPATNNNVETATRELSTFLTLPSTASIDLPPPSEDGEPEQKTKPKKSPKRPAKQDGPIKCPLCEKVFQKVSHYRTHMQEHRNMKKYKCEHCSESYNVEKNFQVHMAMHAKGDPKCPLCDRKFQRLASLKAHLVMHQVEETFVCNECSAEFDKEQEYNAHIEEHIKDQQEVVGSLPLVCTYCGYSFQNSDEYKEHIALHIKAKRAVRNKRPKKRNLNTNREYQHKCEHCPKSFPKLCLLERHRRIHTGERPFACHICNRCFSQKVSLQTHLNKHEGKKPFECMFCSSKFTQKGNLMVHLKRTHTANSPDEKMFRCIHCPCIFKKVASLNWHIARTHIKDSVNISSLIDQLKELDKEAGKTQTKPDTSEEAEAIRVMESEPQVTDNNCFVKLAFSTTEGSVRRYIIKQRKYGDTRWYICSYCTKEFKKPSDLIRHIRKHTREKPFKCKECGQTFALQSTLKKHSNTHIRSTCECVICLKKFSSISTLNVHLRKHDKSAVAHKTRCYKCSVCDKTFVSLDSANEHMTVHEVPDTVVINKDSPKIDINQVMKQPMVETKDGLLPIAAPKPKFTYASMEEYKDRPYKCHVCNAAFLKNVHLKRHMSMHNGIKDFECEYCSKRFVTKYALKEHVNYHTKTKNHECKICKKKFYTNSILSRHIVMHGNQEIYYCPYCKKNFKRPQLCRRHIRRIHKKEFFEKILSISDTSELSPEAKKMFDLSDILNEESFENLNVEPMGDLTPYDSVQMADDDQSSVQQHAVEDAPIVTQEETEITEEGQVEQTEAIEKSVFPEMCEVRIENLPDSNSINIPTIFISSEDLQLLSNSNVVNSLLPQLKLQNTDPLLLSSINELQDTNMLYPLDPSTISKESYDAFNTNIIFNPAINELNIPLAPEKNAKQDKSPELTTEQIDLELNEIASQRVLSDNLIIFNGDVQKGGADINYFNMNFNQTDYMDINELNLPSVGPIEKVMQPNLLEETTNLMCSNCVVYFNSLAEFDKHVCKMGEKEDAVTTEDVLEEIVPEIEENINDVVNEVENDEALVNNEVSELCEEEDTPKEEKKETFACQYCDKTFSVNNTLMRHISFKHKEKIDNSCSICTKIFKKRSDLVRHLRTHTGEKPFSCSICNKSFSLKSTLMTHARTHNPLGVKEFKCQVCNAYVSCKSSLKAHMVLHTDAKRFECNICSMKFRTNHQRKSHIATQHLEPNKITGTKVSNVNLLESMLLETNNEIQNLNSEEKEQEITNTNFQESTQNLLSADLPIENLVLSDVHLDPILLQLPTNNYPMGLQLEIDGQLINMKQNLESVEPIEEETAAVTPQDNKKVQCDICQKTYSSKAVLSKHKRLLHGQYKCDKCSKTFKTEDLRDQHMRLHSGYRPFSCTLCTNSFAEMSNLKVHMRRIHKTVMNK